MSRRVDLYPLVLSKLDTLLEELRAKAPAAENSELASRIAHAAYEAREVTPGVLFDVGGAWNALACNAGYYEGEQRRIVRSLLDGRPLVGAAFDTSWASYAWLLRSELATFDTLLGRIEADAPYQVAEIRTWLANVRSHRRASVFVAVG